MQIDLRVLELLSSKICHDLVSPVSAINNGVELIEDIGGSVVDEAMKLIADSGAKATKRLRLFRIAYGRAGNETALTIKDVRPVVEQYLADGKVTLRWPEDLPSPLFAQKRGVLKTLVNMILMADEILAYGGSIEVKPDPLGHGGCRLDVIGRAAQLSDVFRSALDGVTEIEELSTRTIQPYITGRLCAQFGLSIKTPTTESDHLSLDLSATPSEAAPAAEEFHRQKVESGVFS